MVKASALALLRVPEVNASWTETAILRHKHADIGVAVALDFGLITPIVFAAEGKGPSAVISNEIKSLAERARTKKLKPNEFEGGGFAVSNLGMFGIKQFTGVINPPHAAILAVGAGEARAIVHDGKIEAAYDDDSHDVLRSPRGRWRHGRALPRRLQAIHRRTGRDAAIIGAAVGAMDDLEAIFETSGAAAVEIAASALAERGQQVHPCPNCGKPMIGAYCAVCGQERDTHRRSVWGLAKVFFEDLVSFDSRILRTGWALVTKPGELACAFREGRTQRYLPALRLYLFVSLIFFLVLGLGNIAIMQLVVVGTPVKVTWIGGKAYVPNPRLRQRRPRHAVHAQDGADIEGQGDAARRALRVLDQGLFLPAHRRLSRDPLAGGARQAQQSQLRVRRRKGKAHRSGEGQEGPGGEELDRDPRVRRLAAAGGEIRPQLNDGLTTWIPRVLFLLLPLYAALLALFYIRQRKKFYFVDHLIFSLTIHTFGFVLLMLAAGAARVPFGERRGVGARSSSAASMR